jgi:hypothetical protein
MRRGKVLAYWAAICASWAEIVNAIELDLTSTGKWWHYSRQIMLTDNRLDQKYCRNSRARSYELLHWNISPNFIGVN